MTAELIRRVDALRRPLELAAKDNFRGVRTIAGLGSALRAACDGIIATAPTGAVDALSTWRESLARWEQLDEGQQQVEVARGQRLIARFARPPATKQAVAPEQSIAALLPAQKKPLTLTPSIDDPLALPTHTLPGIGPAFAQRLAEAGLETVEDLLWCLPRRYDDVRDAMPLAKLVGLPDGTRVTFVRERRVVADDLRRAAGDGPKCGSSSIELHDNASALVRWFNVWAGIEKRMPAGSQVTLSGVVRTRGGRLFELREPRHPRDPGAAVDRCASSSSIARREAAAVDLGALSRCRRRVPASKLRVACRAACARVGERADDGVPASIEHAASLPALAETLARLHDPPPTITRDELAALNAGDSAWQRRLAFGELFALGVAVALKRRERRADAAVPCRARGVDRIVDAALPFTLTGAQRRTIGALGADLAKAEPMNRLLQGDVGSGKTAVAFAAAVQVALAGRQSAVMAPTELLAEQHAQTWRRWAERMKQPLRVELLTASTPKAARPSLFALLASKAVDVLIGTHALLSEGVGFGALGLVVIDEQHRFGVAQRAKLRDKGDGQGAPHLLVMTATPIPRTLALTAYGDLDASILDELPPGRTPIVTKLATGKRGEAAAYKVVAERAKTGRARLYLVLPEGRRRAVCERRRAEKDLQRRDDRRERARGRDAAAALSGPSMHGRLDAVARDRVMRAFKQGELDALVATTVIEVGVDVPEATVMIVHDADRFGMAQLHQLRGRVGRGGGASQCVLISHGGISEDGRARLDAIEATTDGFRIAEADLALRGPGELCGPRQAGVPRLRFGSLTQHFELLLEARRHAESVLDDDPGLVRPDHAALRDALARRLSQSVYGPESG